MCPCQNSNTLVTPFPVLHRRYWIDLQVVILALLPKGLERRLVRGLHRRPEERGSVQVRPPLQADLTDVVWVFQSSMPKHNTKPYPKARMGRTLGATGVASCDGWDYDYFGFVRMFGGPPSKKTEKRLNMSDK